MLATTGALAIAAGVPVLGIGVVGLGAYMARDYRQWAVEDAVFAQKESDKAHQFMLEGFTEGLE